MTKDEEDNYTGAFLVALDRNEVRGGEREEALEWLHRYLVNLALIDLLLKGMVDMSWDSKGKCPSFKITDKGGAAARNIISKL
jgi:hypothetical protein